VAEDLDLPVLRVDAGGRGDPDAPAPGPLRKPGDLGRGLDPARQVLDRRGALAEMVAEDLGESPIGDALLRGAGDEAGNGSGDRRHGGGP
jgi:hypothetical protein